MKRDMELLRTILMEIQEFDKSYGLQTLPEVDGFSMDEVSYHAWLLKQDGFIEADAGGGGTGHGYDDFTDMKLTMKGHDFIKLAKDEGIWNKVREHFFKPGVAFTVNLLFEWMHAKAKSMTGLP